MLYFFRLLNETLISLLEHSDTNLNIADTRGHPAEIHLEDMSAKAMKKLEYVFKIAEDREGPLNYETFKSVIQAVVGQRVTYRGQLELCAHDHDRA